MRKRGTVMETSLQRTSAGPCGLRIAICGTPPTLRRWYRTSSYRSTLHLQSFRGELSFEAWLTRILVNRCLDRIRARGRRTRWVVSDPHKLPGREQFWEDLASPWVSPEDGVVARERRQALACALARLPKRKRSRDSVEPLRRDDVTGSGRSHGAGAVERPRSPVSGRATVADASGGWNQPGWGHASGECVAATEQGQRQPPSFVVYSYHVSCYAHLRSSATSWAQCSPSSAHNYTRTT